MCVFCTVPIFSKPPAATSSLSITLSKSFAFLSSLSTLPCFTSTNLLIQFPTGHQLCLHVNVFGF